MELVFKNFDYCQVIFCCYENLNMGGHLILNMGGHLILNIGGDLILNNNLHLINEMTEIKWTDDIWYCLG